MKTTVIVLLACSTWAGWVGSATAQQAGDGTTMYRCGSHFQDRPCDASAAGSKAGTNAAGKTAATASSKAAPVVAKQAAPVVVRVPPPQTTKLSEAEARFAEQKQIRCENFGRQAHDLRQRQKSTPQYAASIEVQLKSLEGRLNADGC